MFFGGAEVFKPFDNVFLYKHVHMYPAHSRIIIIIIPPISLPPAPPRPDPPNKKL